MGKRLVRICEGKVFAGVCGGIAEYFDLEVSKIRIAWVISVLFFGTGLFIYIILALILPKKSLI